MWFSLLLAVSSAKLKWILLGDSAARGRAGD